MSNLNMDFDQLTDKLMPILHEILVLRLPHSRSWGNVSIETGQRYMDICWQDPKDGKDYSQTKRVQPFNTETLTKEISFQWYKLQSDIKQAQQ